MSWQKQSSLPSSGATAQPHSGDAGRAEQSSHQLAPGIISLPSSPPCTASIGHKHQQISPRDSLGIWSFSCWLPQSCVRLLSPTFPCPLASQITRKSDIPGTPFKGALHWVLHPSGFLPLPHPNSAPPTTGIHIPLLKPQTHSLLIVFALNAFSTPNSLFTSSVTFYDLPIKASSTIRDLCFLRERTILKLL